MYNPTDKNCDMLSATVKMSYISIPTVSVGKYTVDHNIDMLRSTVKMSYISISTVEWCQMFNCK